MYNTLAGARAEEKRAAEAAEIENIEVREDDSMRTTCWVGDRRVGLLLVGAPPMRAHHAFSAEFDISKPLKLQGTLTKWEMINPHSWFHVDVKGPDRSVVPWLDRRRKPESADPSGRDEEHLEVGTEFIIEGYQARDGTNKAVGRSFLFADGRSLFVGGSAPGAAGPAQ